MNFVNSEQADEAQIVNLDNVTTVEINDIEDRKGQFHKQNAYFIRFLHINGTTSWRFSTRASRDAELERITGIVLGH